jgi:two-component system response regulator AtoC
VRVPEEHDVRVLGSRGISVEEAVGLSRHLLGEGCRPRVLAQVDNDIAANFPGLAARAGAVLWHPLCAEDRVLGVVYLERQRLDSPRPFGPDDVDLVATYASMTSVLLLDRFREQFELPEVQPGCDDLHPAMRRMITTDPAMYRIMGLAQKVAVSNCTVLLGGETGTGKGLLAHSIHLVSPRRGRKFLALNCAALPEQLLESELFGHARGSFTGADSEKMGLFEAASGGTVFLDEVGKTSLFMQGKLLQFLDSSEVRPVGSNAFRKVDVRVIVATKGNLKELVSQGLFLEDLYYRLNDFPINIPPLRARRGDVRPLVDHYLRVYADEMHKQISGVSRQAMQLLESYAWPGNVRELEKSLKRAVILSDDRQPITARHLPDDLKTASGFVDEEADGFQSMTLRQHVAHLEANLIQACLRRTAGNKSEAARMLGISYPSLLQKIKLYGAVAEVGDA